MRRLLAVAALVLVPGMAAAETNRAFGQLRDKAQAIESLASFLSSFVGDCGADPVNGSECNQKVKAFRTEAIGKTYYVILDDSAQQLVQPRAFSPQTHEMEFALTPFFESAGLALTHGQPSKLDEQGRPVIPLIQMKSKLNENIMPMDVDRAFRTGQVRMQVIFKPLSIWKMPRRDKKNAFVEGVKAQILAVRLSEARSGEEIVSWTSSR